MPVDELVANIDSLTFCLSKGLSCPVGSLVCGSEEFINRARKFRKMLGGGMRQAGILAAAGIWALNNMVSRLIEDHDNAQKMFSLLQNISEVEVLNKSVDTNMVYLRPRNIEPGLYVRRLKEKGVLVGSMYGSVRMVTHYGINSEDIDATVEAIEHTLK